jgi:hypothetical protein
MSANAMLQYLKANDGIIHPTIGQLDQYIRHCAMYEVRNDHAQAFNSPSLGVHKAYFLPKDGQALFDIFNLDPALITNALKLSTEIHDKSHVIRNEFNIGTIWMIYCINLANTLPTKKRKDCQLTLLKMLNYKFFTGKVNHLFPYGADEAVMDATIDGLSFKCDIKRPETPTWKAVIESHCTNIMSTSSIHKNTLLKFEPDGKVGYILSDLQTRLGSKLVNIASAYYENHKNQNKIGESTFLGTDKEGEKVLKELKASLDSSVSRICSDVLNINTFLNYEDIKLVCKLVPSVRPDMLKTTLSVFSNMAYMQYKNKQGEEVIEDNKHQKIYVGYRTLVTELIQKTYRHCIMSSIDIESHLAVLNKTRDIYRASRIANPDIITVKNSVDYFTVKHTKYTREATLISVRTAFILYMIICSFK